MSDFIIEEFYNEMRAVRIEPYGILDSSGIIHTLGTDSKIIGRIFEMYAQPILNRIAQRHALYIKTPESQTVYPDFVLMRSERATDKIAVDIKTTYIDSDYSTIKFTLGSFGSYMRNNTKNIEYKYTDYAKHYVIGFIYKRNGRAQESLGFSIQDRGKIEFPFSDVKYFIQEKYRISGDKPGSGNTENIGSISSRHIEDYIDGNGPFSVLGEDAFEIYWKYYPKYRSENRTYTSLEEFLDWFPEQDPASIQLLHPYDYRLTLQRILDFSKRIRY